MTHDIDFEGFLEGEAFEGGKAEGFDLKLGSKQFIPGFEDQMTGMKKGEKKRITIKFPDNYQAENLRGKNAEFDIFLENDAELVVIEVKTTVKKEDVDYFLEKLMRFKEWFPRYMRYKVYGAVAGISFEEGVDRYAYRCGLFVLRSEGGIICIANDPKFRPRVW